MSVQPGGRYGMVKRIGSWSKSKESYQGSPWVKGEERPGKVVGNKPPPKMSIWAQRRVVEKPYDVGLRKSRYDPPRTKSYGFIPIGVGGGVGPRGPPGVAGMQGPPGRDGVDGMQGPRGVPGISIQGPPGVDGIGIKGDQGERGAKGDRGVRGDRGKEGKAGAVGPQGDRGVKGDRGERGVPGKDGVQGPSGPAGRDGIDRFINDNISDREMREVGGVGVTDIVHGVAQGVGTAARGVGNAMYTVGGILNHGINNFANMRDVPLPRMTQVEPEIDEPPEPVTLAIEDAPPRPGVWTPQPVQGLTSGSSRDRHPWNNLYNDPPSNQRLEITIPNKTGTYGLPGSSSSSSAGNDSGESYDPDANVDVDKMKFSNKHKKWGRK